MEAMRRYPEPSPPLELAGPSSPPVEEAFRVLWRMPEDFTAASDEIVDSRD